jgi:hypothetical protein
MNFPANISGYGSPPVAQLLQDATSNAKRARSDDTDDGEDSQAAAKHFHQADEDTEEADLDGAAGAVAAAALEL